MTPEQHEDLHIFDLPTSKTRSVDGIQASWGYSWQQLCELRRQQLEAWRAEQARQLALFELRD